jgi:FtsZ-interacting cell division protein ZipA
VTAQLQLINIIIIIIVIIIIIIIIKNAYADHKKNALFRKYNTKNK